MIPEGHSADPLDSPLMPLALGRHLLFREISKGGWLAIALVIAIVLLVVYWPRVAGWMERHWFRR
jgi:hypothetical protein